MSKFKVERGDYVCIQELDKKQVDDIVEAFEAAGGINKGDIDYRSKYILFDYRDGEIWARNDDLSKRGCGSTRQVSVSDILEDRTNWHPHHDVIVAWAKGAKVQYKEYKSAYEPDSWKWVDHLGISAPAWYSNIEYRVKPEPDHTAEIAEIEQEMRKLSESQKELADRLEKLKGD